MRRASDRVASRVSTEESRQASRYALGLIEASLDPLFMLTADGGVADMNRAALEIVGRARDDVLGSDFASCFTDSDRVRDCHGRVLGDGKVADFPLTVRNGSGRVVPVVYNAAVFRDTEGGVAGVFASLHDVSARDEAEEQLREQNRRLELRLGRFARRVGDLEDEIVGLQRQLDRKCEDLDRANYDIENVTRRLDQAERAEQVTHETRALLNSILAFSQLLLTGTSGNLNDEQRRQLGMIVHSAQHVIDLGHGKDAGSAEASPRIDRKPVKAFDLVESVSGYMRPGAIAKGLSFDSHCELECVLYSDAGRIEQVLLNLVTNAVRYTDSGEVCLEARRDGDDVVFRVTDTGMGIPVEDLPKLFDEYHRSVRADLRARSGPGLGLPVSKRLVEMLGGSIEVSSEEGQGTVFTVRLPAQPSAA